MKFRLLGKVAAYPDDGDIDLFSGLQPLPLLLLAALLAAEGRRVGADRLIEQLWDDHLPADPRGRLYHCVSKLRAALKAVDPAGTVKLLRDSGGYRIQAGPGQIDASRFGIRAGEARQVAGTNPEQAISLWRAALSEWGPGTCALRGSEPLAGLPGRWAEHYRNTLQSQHRDAVIACLEAELQRGKPERLIAELTSLAADEAGRLDEHLARLRMLAFYRSNRQAEALRTYQHIQEELRAAGLELSSELKLLSERIRNRDQTLGGTTGDTVASESTISQEDEETTSSGDAETTKERRGEEGSGERRNSRSQKAPSGQPSAVVNIDGPLHAPHSQFGIQNVYNADG